MFWAGFEHAETLFEHAEACFEHAEACVGHAAAQNEPQVSMLEAKVLNLERPREVPGCSGGCLGVASGSPGSRCGSILELRRRAGDRKAENPEFVVFLKEFHGFQGSRGSKMRSRRHALSMF